MLWKNEVIRLKIRKEKYLIKKGEKRIRHKNNKIEKRNKP